MSVKKSLAIGKVAGGNHCAAPNEPEPSAAAALEFDVEGTRYTLASMLAANACDEDFCAWALAARPGDFYPGLIRCQCVQPGDLSEADLLEIDRQFDIGKASGALQAREEHLALELQVHQLRCAVAL